MEIKQRLVLHLRGSKAIKAGKKWRLRRDAGSGILSDGKRWYYQVSCRGKKEADRVVNVLRKQGYKVRKWLNSNYPKMDIWDVWAR